MTSLCQLLSSQDDPAAVVSLRGETRRELARDVGRLATTLEDRPTFETGRGYVLQVDDTYAFAVGLFGLWHAGCHAILPPNRQEHTLRALDSRSAGIITDVPTLRDRPDAIHPREGPADEGADIDVQEHRGDASPLEPLSAEALAVELFTSGTTGDNRSIAKRIRHLDAEVRELDALFGGDIGDAAVFSTAAAHHLYGLLFGVLAPLTSGRPFCPERLHHPREIVPRLLEAPRAVLISVPSTLKQLARHDATGRLRGRCAALFSSGGPLATETAIALAKHLGESPIEIFGSTETGGVAFRQQRPEARETPWTPFPSVQLERQASEGRLRVRSPFVGAAPAPGGGDEESFVMGDRATLLPDGRFHLEGRVDQIVKIAEKRVDLALMGEVLRRHEAIEEVALVPLERDAQTRIAAVVVPTPHGRELLEREGRSGFQRRLRSHLAGDFDPVVHPRFLRVANELPTNAQGKTPAESIRALFRTDEPADRPTHRPARDPTNETEAAVADRPLVLGEVRGEDFIERECRVPPDLDCFAGHFPDLPVVPGVLQLDWAMDLVGSLIEGPARLAAVDSLKLLAPLGPGQAFRVRAQSISPGRFSLELTSADATHAKARVRLRDD